jgi:uncharacterized protein
MISKQLILELKDAYRLDWHGVHGVAHWARVRHIGLKLSKETGANPRVIEAFAFLHDSQRHNDKFDPEHGLRACHLAGHLLGRSLHLSAIEFDLLVEACQFHTFGHIDADITIQTCWDADRLDLRRVGIMPRADLLCTLAAKKQEMIQWAYDRSRR